MINITDSEEVCKLNFHCVALCAYLQKDDADNLQFENHISEVSADVQGSDEPFSTFEAEYTEEVHFLLQKNNVYTF